MTVQYEFRLFAGIELCPDCKATLLNGLLSSSGTCTVKCATCKNKIELDFHNDMLVLTPDQDFTPIESLNLSARVSNALKRADINTIGDLLHKIEHAESDSRIFIRNIGPNAIMELRQQMSKYQESKTASNMR